MSFHKKPRDSWGGISFVNIVVYDFPRSCLLFFFSPEHSFSMRHCCVRFNFSEALNQNWWRHIKRKHLRLPLFSVTITPRFSVCSLWTATQMKSCCSTYRKSQNDDDDHDHHHACMFFYFCMTQKTLYASQSDLVYKICGQILFILRSPVRDMGGGEIKTDFC